MQDEAKRVPHYGLRKLSVGVASVLLSTTLFFGVSAHADTTNPDTQSSADETSQESNATGITNQSAKSVTLSDASDTDNNQTKSGNNDEATAPQNNVRQDNQEQTVKTSSNEEKSNDNDINKNSVKTTDAIDDVTANNSSVNTKVDNKTSSNSLDNPNKNLLNGILNLPTNYGLNKSASTSVLNQLSVEMVANDSDVDTKTGEVIFVDKITGKKVGTWSTTGKVGEKIYYTGLEYHLPAGYLLSGNQSISGGNIITSDGIPPVTAYVQKNINYYLERKIIEHLPTGDKIIHQYVQFRTANRTFEIGQTEGSLSLAGNIVYGSRTGQSINDGTIEYNGKFAQNTQSNPAMPSQKLNAVTVDQVDGYTVKGGPVESISVEPLESVDGLQQDSAINGSPVYVLNTIDIYYEPKVSDQTTHIIYQDTSGNKVKTDTVSGKPGQTVDTKSSVPAGWEIADSSAVKTVPKTITFTDGKTVPDTIITIEHIVTIVTPDTPKTDIPTGPVPGNPDNNYPSIDQSSLKKKTVTRTIYAKYPSGETKVLTKQQVEFQTTVAVDHATGQVTTTGFKTKDAKTGEWINDYGMWTEYNVPTVNGFKSDQSQVQSKEINGDAQDQNVYITYTPIEDNYDYVIARRITEKIPNKPDKVVYQYIEYRNVASSSHDSDGEKVTNSYASRYGEDANGQIAWT